MSTTLKSPAASRWFAASASALAVAMTMGLSAPASATECLLDTNNDGVVGAGDTRNLYEPNEFACMWRRSFRC